MYKDSQVSNVKVLVGHTQWISVAILKFCRLFGVDTHSEQVACCDGTLADQVSAIPECQRIGGEQDEVGQAHTQTIHYAFFETHVSGIRQIATVSVIG